MKWMRNMNEVTPATPKRHHKIFLWFFLAVQAIFVLWLVFGVTDAQTSSSCTPGYEDACNAGTAIGVFLVVFFWVLVDVILGISYGVYRLAKR